MLVTDDMRRAAARAALRFVEPHVTLGIGSGATVSLFIDALADSRTLLSAAVAASRSSAAQLERAGVRVLSLAEIVELPVYIDGADEIDPTGRLIKGRGGAHTMEKVLASVSRQFVCIVDEGKLVDSLGEKAPVPLEVLPEAVRFVSARLQAMGARVKLREKPAEKTGNLLLDAEGLDLSDAVEVERMLNALPGVVDCGVFALRRADLALVGVADGSVRELAFA
jgi:ribose 5-phosphate isomerase A